MDAAPHTLVAGIGNVLMADDAAGPTVAAYLRARYEFGPGVRVADLGTPGIDLALHLTGPRTVVIVDAMENFAQQTGTVRIFSREEILAAGAPARFDAHSPALREALLLAEMDGAPLEQVRLVGIAARCFEMGTPMDPAIVSRLDEILEAVLGVLRELGVECKEKLPPEPPGAWWLSQAPLPGR